MVYKAIGFDWGGVLNGRPGKQIGEKISTLLGIDHEEYLVAYFHHSKKFNQGDITSSELWGLVLGELGRSDRIHEVMDIAQEFNSDSLNKDVLNLVDNLRTLGYKVGLLSNNTRENAVLMRSKGIDRHFDVFHVSAETGLVKPDPEAYRYFASSLGVELVELIFIDDSDKSLSTSEQCGFTPLLYLSFEQLTEELGKLGVI